MKEEEIAHKLFKSAKYNQFSFDSVCKRFGVDTITGRMLISKYYGDIINPEFVTTREDLVAKVKSILNHKPVLLMGPTACGKTSIARQSAEGNVIEVDLADGRSSGRFRELVLDSHKFPDNTLILENLDAVDGRSQGTVVEMITESRARLIFTSTSNHIPESVKNLLEVMEVSRPDIMDVTAYIKKKYPGFVGNIPELYEECRGDIRRMTRCIVDDIVDKGGLVEGDYELSVEKACRLVMYETDREKVYGELQHLKEWYLLLPTLRQNIQYAYTDIQAAEALSKIDTKKFSSKPVLYGMLASFPLATKKLGKIYFPSFPRKKKKKEKEEIKITKEKKVKSKPKTEDIANDI